MTSHREITIIESEDDERSSRNPSGSGQGDKPTGPVEDADRDEAESRTEGLDLIYHIEASPSWYLSLIFGFQHYLTMFGSTLGIPLILSLDLCMADNPVDVGKLIGTEFFVSGLATLIQTTVGNRLPIVQGASLSFLGPAQVILRSNGACPDPLTANATEEDIEMRAEFWQSRMRILQGAILVASLVEVFIGFTGVIGVLLRFIGPMTIAPTLCLIGLSLFQTAANFAGNSWIISGTDYWVLVIGSYADGIFVLFCCARSGKDTELNSDGTSKDKYRTFCLIAIFSQYLGRFSLPLPGYSSSDRCHMVKFPIFKVFPVILSVLIAWILAAILTTSNALPEGSPVRTDFRKTVLADSPWFYIPHPFQWGVPVVTIAGVLGMIAGVLASTVESIGDYFACARVAGAPPPPDHAVNRGIGMEGIGCILAGFWGTGLGTTSYSQNIGVIGITKVGSRRVVQVGALFMIFLGSFGKFGAFFATIPIPIIGGMFCVLFGLVAAVGLSNLQLVDLDSSRNQFVLGTSLFMGLTVPAFIQDNPGAINTRSQEFNQIVTVLLSVNMFVGGVIAAFLDNTIPGTEEERGLIAARKFAGQESQQNSSLAKCYELPFGMQRIRRVSFLKYLPFSPTFKGFKALCRPDSPFKTNNGAASVKYDVVGANNGEEVVFKQT